MIKTTTTATMKLLPMPPGLGATEGELERLVCSSLSSCILLENYLRCVIQVIVLVVQANGTVLGSAVNCAVLALLDAGVAMGGGTHDDGVLAGSRRGGGPIYSFIN
jgi:ribonuclease PH